MKSLFNRDGILPLLIAATIIISAEYILVKAQDAFAPNDETAAQWGSQLPDSDASGETDSFSVGGSYDDGGNDENSVTEDGHPSGIESDEIEDVGENDEDGDAEDGDAEDGHSSGIERDESEDGDAEAEPAEDIESTDAELQDNAEAAVLFSESAVTDAAGLTTAASGGGKAVLSDNIDLTDQLTVSNDLILDLGGNTLTIAVGGGSVNGVELSSGVKLTIDDSGSGGELVVTNTYTGTESGYGAAINVTGGELVVIGGKVIAIGGDYGAGIGGGHSGDGGTITIDGGEVDAQGGSNGAGIGGGYGGNGGAITIIKGRVTAAGGSNGGAGIGGGYGSGYGGDGGTIIITGGGVDVKGGSNGAGIGGGMFGDGGTIDISGGFITAEGGSDGAGIGGGYGGGGGMISISGGTVNAKKGNGTNLKDIGSGEGGTPNSTEFTGGSIFVSSHDSPDDAVDGLSSSLYPVKVTVKDGESKVDGANVDCGGYEAVTGSNLTDAFDAASPVLDSGVAWIWLSQGDHGVTANYGAKSGRQKITDLSSSSQLTVTLTDRTVVTVNPPIKGETPSAVTDPGDYYSGAVVWSGKFTDSGKFAGGEIYTATVTLTASGTDIKFSEGFTAKVEHGYEIGNALISDAGATATFTVRYAALPPKELVAAHVTSQPDKTSYYSGEKLDMTGLVVTAQYDDGTESPITPEGYEIDGETVTPGSTVLTRNAHDGKPISISYNGSSVLSGSLTVKIPPTITSVAVSDITSYGATIDYTVTANTGAAITDDLKYKTASGGWITATNSTPITGLTPATVYEYLITASDGEKTATYSGSFKTANQSVSGITLEGDVIDSGNPSVIRVTLESGSTVLASANALSANINTYHFTLKNIPDGVYNLVADNGASKVTQAVIITNGAVSYPALDISIQMPTRGKRSRVNNAGEETPPVAAGGLMTLFDDNSIYTTDDQALVAANGTVEIGLHAKAISAASLPSGTVPSNESIGLYLDLSVIKYRFNSEGALLDTQTLEDLNNNIISITFELPPPLDTKTVTSIYREHKGSVDTITTVSRPEYFEQTGRLITLHVNKFSVYAFAYSTGASVNSGGSSKIGSSSVITKVPVPAHTHWIEVPEAKMLAEEANTKGLSYARSYNLSATGIRKDALRILACLRYRHDTLSNGGIQTRISVKNPEKAVKDILVSGYVTSDGADRTRERFEKAFRNRLAVISMDQRGDFGITVNIAAKVGLDGMNMRSLHFYSYDKEENRYIRFNTEYRIDANGYLHFATLLAGDIIISSGPLTKDAADSHSTDYARPAEVDPDNPNTGGDSVFDAYIPELEKTFTLEAGYSAVGDIGTETLRKVASRSSELRYVSDGAENFGAIKLGVLGALMLLASGLLRVCTRREYP